MPIPNSKDIMIPILTLIQNGKDYRISLLYDLLAEHFNLSDSERNEYYPSGSEKIFENRVRWSRLYLKNNLLIESSRRGYVKITEKGKQWLSKPTTITTSIKNNKETKSTKKKILDIINLESELPEEIIERNYNSIREQLKEALLKLIKEQSPNFFENLVIDLLVKMGYGGSRIEAGRAVGKSGDGGIDGIINEDKLGLDKIYIQAKKWENVVPIKEIRDFAGALLSQKSKKGIFITTSHYPQSAYDYVGSIGHNIILIDGKKLTELMIDNNIGLSVQMKYEVKKIDFDYFEEI